MGFLDDMKRKAEGLAEQHGDKIVGGIDKVANAVDAKTGGQHSDKVGTGATKAKEMVEKLGRPGPA